MESSSSSSSNHRSGTNTSELFICFTSRNNMKASSKSSILSPGRARDPPISLSTSLSRRLKNSGSIKNGQASPMFPTGCKKRGSGFENPEPSSPKVTCIGQVRVKTKKQGKKMRNLSRRRSGEMSFRKIEHNQIQRSSSVNSQYQECSSHRNQRWVHLPLTICETLRGLGSEFSCLFPCRSSCFSGNEREKEEREGRDSSSCGAVFAKWLVAVQEDGGKGRDIELVVREEEEDEEEEIRPISRKHVFDEIEIKDDVFEEGRVSICIPPKNALLLMRCRSDPVKMEALANKFWEPQLQPAEDEEDGGNERDGEMKKDEQAAVNFENVVQFKEEVGEMLEKEKLQVFEERRASFSANEKEKWQVFEPKRASFSVNEKLDNVAEPEVNQCQVEEVEVAEEVQESAKQENQMEELQITKEVQVVEEEVQRVVIEEENESSFVTALEALFDQENGDIVVDKQEERSRVSYSSNSFLLNSDDEVCKPEEKQTKAVETALEFDTKEKVTLEENDLHEELVEKVTLEKQITETKAEEEEKRVVDVQEEDVNSNALVLERESDLEIKKEERETASRLPECLLLMMCEPKLSMEVSKETWVCSTDFIRWRPQKKKNPATAHQHKKSGAGDNETVTKKRNSVDSKSSNPFAALPPQYRPVQNQPAVQPGRSSCSLPAASSAVSMATMIEQKLVDAVAYEPFVLSRCKSEPMRTASKLAQDAFWKSRSRAIEPHRRATCGVGAAGVGC